MPAKKFRNLNHQSRAQTQIIDDLEVDTVPSSDHPHCILPNIFFERHQSVQSDLKVGRTLLSVSTWDGRNIFEVGVAAPK